MEKEKTALTIVINELIQYADSSTERDEFTHDEQSLIKATLISTINIIKPHLELERKQIEKAFMCGNDSHDDMSDIPFDGRPKQYYTQTYGNE